MTETGDDAKRLQMRLTEVAGYRMTASEAREVQALLDMVRGPFDIGRVTGDDPAMHFRPVSSCADDLPL